MSIKPSATTSWTTDMLAIMPGNLRTAQPFNRSFTAISNWIDAVTTGNDIASEKVKLANLPAAVSSFSNIVNGDTLGGALRKLEYKTNLTRAASGEVTVPSTANSTVSQAVTFPTNRFAKAPKVSLAVDSTNPHHAVVSFANVTATGFTVYNRRVNDTATVIHWTAIQEA
jgi:hypothetical protein